jgi:hypothetical protein
MCGSDCGRSDGPGGERQGHWVGDNHGPDAGALAQPEWIARLHPDRGYVLTPESHEECE